MKRLVWCLLGVVALNVSAIQMAGDLLVDLRAADMVGNDVGTKVQSWQNHGDQGGVFTNVVAGQGPEFRTYGSANTPAVYFSRENSNSILTGMRPDARITGTGSWTLETWINIPVLESGNTTFFSWTFRGASRSVQDGGDGLGGPERRLFEARWTRDNGNAIEHHSGNVGWNGSIPAENQWHHIVMTRDGTEAREYIYVDGVQVQNVSMSNVNILPDGIFIIGGTLNGARTAYEMLATAYIGQIRVYTDFMPLLKARSNFLEERVTYGSPNLLGLWGNPSTDPAEPWETAGNWVGGYVPESVTRVTIANGGSAELSKPVGLIRSLEVTDGALTLSGNAALEMWANAAGYQLYVANANDAVATLNVTEGFIGVRDRGYTSQFIVGNNAGSLGTVNIGGGELPGRIEINRDSYVGNNAGATGQLTVWTNGTLAKVGEENGFIYVGSGRGEGTVTVNGGTILYPRLQLLNGGLTGILEMNDGFVRLTDSLFFSGGTAYTDSQAIAYLNGGVLQTRWFNVDKKTGVNAVYFNGTTVRNTEGQGNFIYDGVELFVREGGAIFDVISGTEISIARTFLHDPDLAAVDGGLTKTGPGTLRLTGVDSSFTGDIHVEDGILLFSTANALSAAYQGKIRLDNPNAVVGCTEAGGNAWMLSLIATNAVGHLAIFGENATEAIDLSNHPGLKLSFRGTMTYSGAITPAVAGQLALSPLQGAVLTYDLPITGTTALLVEGQGNGTLVLGNNNTYSGGTTVRGGKIRLNDLNQQLGSGLIKLENDGALLLNAGSIDPVALLAKIDPTSRGYILVNGSTAGLSFDLSGHPGIYLGTAENAQTYNGTLTHTGDYRLGGGWLTYRAQNVTGLSIGNLTDNGAIPRGVAVEGEGLVRILNAGSTFTGDIAVTNKGGLFIGTTANQLGGTTNLFVNDGTLRAEGNVTVPWSVAVTVGPEGMELHPWGSRYTHFEGDLNGDGRIFTTDSGGVFFGDASGFTGVFDPCRSGSTLGVGVGNTLGWNSSTVITNSGFDIGYFGVQYDGNTDWTTAIGRPLGSDSPRLGLKKRGTGTLEVNVAHAYNGDTLVEEGTLKVTHPSAIPNGTGKGWVGVSEGAFLDVNGHNLDVNALINPGLVFDSTGTAQGIRAGIINSSWTMNTSVDSALTLVKAGTGTVTLNSSGVHDVDVEAGTVLLANPAGILGDFSLDGTSTLQVNGPPVNIKDDGGQQGLKAYYYQMGNANQLTTSLMPTLAALNQFFLANTPTLITDTLLAGDTLDFGRTTATCRFPDPFDVEGANNFIAIYRGTFLAEVAGDYTFGLQSDDSSILFINGAVAANLNVGSHGWNGTVQAGDPIHLNAGEHEIVIGFFEIGGEQGLTVSMMAPSEEVFSPIPQSLLSTYSDAFVSRVGGVSGGSTARFHVNGHATVAIGSSELGNTDTFTGTMTNSPFSTLRKSGSGRQVLASPALTLGYVDVCEGVLELATPGNAPAFLASYLSTGNPNTSFTGVTMSSLTGGTPGGVLLLNDGGLLKMSRATEDTRFNGVIEGPAQSVIVKADDQLLTLTGNNDGFLGMWIIHSGGVELPDGGTMGSGLVINNGELYVDKDEDYTMTLSGTGTVVKRGGGTLYVRSENNATLMQNFIVEGGNVIFDTQGSTLFFAGTMNVGEGCSWGGMNGGKVVVLNGDGLSGITVAIDGTEWVFQTGTGASPVQDGLTVALDASRYRTLDVNGAGIVTQWNSVAGEMVYTNENLALSPLYNPGAFGGRGGVMFGTNSIGNTKAGTRLSSTAQTHVKTVFIVGHVAGSQPGFGGMFGQTAADKGIRFGNDSAPITYLRNSSGDDFVNSGGTCFLNGESASLTVDVGLSPFVLTQYGGANTGNHEDWNSTIRTTLGHYNYSQASRYFWGELGELLVYDRALSNEERTMVDGYLMTKWLSSSMPTYETPEGMVIELSNGGVLNLGGASNTQTVSTVICGAGGGNVMNGTLVITDAFVINVKPDGSTDPLSFNNVVIGPDAKLIVNGIENARGTIEVFTADSATPSPLFAKENLPKGWTATYRNNVCRLSIGSTIIILR